MSVLAFMSPIPGQAAAGAPPGPCPTPPRSRRGSASLPYCSAIARGSSWTRAAIAAGKRCSAGGGGRPRRARPGPSPRSARHRGGRSGAELGGPAERLLDRHLLVELEADEQRERVGDEQPVGLVVAGEWQSIERGRHGRHGSPATLGPWSRDRRLIDAPHLLDVVGGTWLADRRILVDDEPDRGRPRAGRPGAGRCRAGRPSRATGSSPVSSTATATWSASWSTPASRRSRPRPAQEAMSGVRNARDDAAGRVHDGPRRGDVPGVRRRRPARRHRSRLDARAADAVRRRLHHRARAAAAR